MSKEQVNTGRDKITLSDLTGGLNLFTEPKKLKENEFTQLENAVLYVAGRYGNITRRKGFTNYCKAVTNGTKIIKIYEYINQVTNKSYLIAKTNDKLWAYDIAADSWAEVDAADGTLKTRFDTYNDIAYIFNRYNSTTPLKNKVYNGTDYYDMGLIPCPQNFYLVRTTSTGNLTGTYHYLITYLYDNIQESSVLLRNNAFAGDVGDGQSNRVSATPTYNAIPMLVSRMVHCDCTGANAAKTVIVKNIPTGNTTYGKSRITARRIYRTKGMGSILYYHSQINDNTTTEFTDNTPDANLVSELDLATVFEPECAKFGIRHNNKLYIANLADKIYDIAPVTTGISFVEGSSGSLTVSGDTRVSKYSYKFSHLFITYNNEPLTGKPYSGFYSKMSDAVSHEFLDAAKDDLTLSAIPNTYAAGMPYAGKIALFRNVCRFVSGTASVGSGTVKTTITTTGVSSTPFFKNGERVYLSGITFTDTTVLTDGLYEISNVTNGSGVTTFEVGFDSYGKTYASGGRAEGGTYYYLGCTALIDSSNAETFYDTIGDSDLVINGDKMPEQNNLLYISTNKTYPSTVKWSDNDNPDIFPFANEANIESSDNNKITGISSDNSGIIIFKDKNIYKLYTTGVSEYRKLVTGIGLADTDTIHSLLKLDDGSFFFYFNNKFYIWGGEGDRPLCISDKIQTILDPLTIINLDTCYDSKNNYIWVTYQTSSISGNCLVLDLNFKNDTVWYHFVKNTTALGVNSPIFLRSANTVVFGNDLCLFPMKYHTTNIDNIYVTSALANVAIAMALKTKEFDLNRTNIKQVRVKYYTDKNGATNGLGGTIITDASSNVLTGHTLATGTGRYKESVDINGKFIQLQLTNSDNCDFSIIEIQLITNERHLEDLYTGT